MNETINDLHPHQTYSFFESVATMINAENEENKRSKYLAMMMESVNLAWKEALKKALSDDKNLEKTELSQIIHHCLQVNAAVCTALGPYFLPQMQIIYNDTFDIYK